MPVRALTDDGRGASMDAIDDDRVLKLLARLP
jgi:hypothetical protein